jgi:hypothetical protein
MVQQPITVIVTSCDRFDLLEKTLDSFFKLNTYPLEKVIINNDSDKLLNKSDIDFLNKYEGCEIEFLHGIKRGLSASWDFLVSRVETEYFFNLEDDWVFSGNEFFILDSITLLENTHYNQVWIRNHNDIKHPIAKHSETINGVEYRRVLSDGAWCGFSFNPSVRNTAKWRAMFPNGVSGLDEIEISRNVYNFYSACVLENTSIKHIGYNRHSKNFQI